MIAASSSAHLGLIWMRLWGRHTDDEEAKIMGPSQPIRVCPHLGQIGWGHENSELILASSKWGQEQDMHMKHKWGHPDEAEMGQRGGGWNGEAEEETKIMWPLWANQSVSSSRPHLDEAEMRTPRCVIISPGLRVAIKLCLLVIEFLSWPCNKE